MKHLSLTLGYPSERERGEMGRYPGPWEVAPEEMAGRGGDSGGRREDEWWWWSKDGAAAKEKRAWGK
jgi:hypothetical protein